jgi:hypothetical protein
VEQNVDSESSDNHAQMKHFQVIVLGLTTKRKKLHQARESVVPSLIKSALEPLTESFIGRMSDDGSLVTINQLLKVTVSFALGLLELLDEDTVLHLTDDADLSAAKPDEKETTTARSQGSTAVGSVVDMLQVIFEPFFGKMDNYTELESKQLLKDLEQAGAMRSLDDIIKSQNNESGVDISNTSQFFQELHSSLCIPLSMDPGPFQSAVDGLGRSISHLPSILEGGVSRCLSFTSGVESHQLLKAMTHTVQEFCSYLQDVNRQLRTYCLQSTTPVSSNIDLRGGGGGGGARATTSESASVTAKEIFTRYSWAFLHSSLRLVEHLTKLQRRFSEADTYIRHTLLENCTPPHLHPPGAIQQPVVGVDSHYGGNTSIDAVLRGGVRGMVRVVSQIRTQRNKALGAGLVALLHSFEANPNPNPNPNP